jgi:phytoene/squalene synthetase
MNSPMKTKSTEAAITKSYRRSEEIAARKHPHLYRVASLFPDQDRYWAFCAAYASMRWIDDRIDNSAGSAEELARWQEETNLAHRGKAGSSLYGPALADTFRRFDLPLEPWEKLAGAMKFDLLHSGFESYDIFLSYAEGATVAPAAVFSSLLLQRPKGDRFEPPISYDVIHKAVRKAAIVCYEVHILRDAKEDIAAGRNYFPRDELDAYHLIGPHCSMSDWTEYLQFYIRRTQHRLRKALTDMDTIEAHMTSREKLMLHLLIEFYIYSLEKIITQDNDIWNGRHFLSQNEISNIVIMLQKRYDPDSIFPSLELAGSEDV